MTKSDPDGWKKIESMVAAGKLPSPGQGPTKEQRAKIKFQTIIDCEALQLCVLRLFLP